MKVSLFIPLLLIITSCHKNIINSTDILAHLPSETLLAIPTYDGSGECVHPDILYLNPPLRGNHFLLTFTPYPYFYNSRLENPSLLASIDGINFHEEKPGMNPLVPPTAYDHNDDPDILYDAERQVYVIHYLETMRPDSENIIRLESKDALSWTRQTAIHYDLHTDGRFIVSPAVCRLYQGGYVMYHVNLSKRPYKIEWLSSSDGRSWNKKIINSISSDLNDTLTPWHLDILTGNDRYYLLVSCRSHINDSQHQKIMLGESTDLLNWHFHPKPVIETDTSFHNCQSIYRSSGLISGHTIGIWYSMVDMDNKWRIGFEKFNMDTL